jgi:hypothetical protein
VVFCLLGVLVAIVVTAYWMAQNPDEVSDTLAGDPSFTTMLYRSLLGWWWGDLDGDGIRTAAIYGYIGGGVAVAFLSIVLIYGFATRHCTPLSMYGL